MYLSVSIIFFLLESSRCFDESSPHTEIFKKIVGGHDCSTEKYPFMVSIRTSTRMKHFCGGSLIKSDWVLTAAHCITTTNPKYYTVIAGTSEIDQNGIQRLPAKAVFGHPKFNKKNLKYDIALIQLIEGFDMSSKLVGLIQIPSFLNVADVKDSCTEGTVIGWGHRGAWSPNGAPLSYFFNPILQCIKIPVLSEKECIKLRGKPVKTGIFCTYSEGGDKDACQGDSGGPFFCGDIQYGVVSSGYGCGQENSPGYYTRVDRNLEFIKSIIFNDLLPRAGSVDTSNCEKTVEYSFLMICMITWINRIK